MLYECFKYQVKLGCRSQLSEFEPRTSACPFRGQNHSDTGGFGLGCEIKTSRPLVAPMLVGEVSSVELFLTATGAECYILE